VRTNIDVGKAENIYRRIKVLNALTKESQVYANSRDRMKRRINRDLPLLQLAHLRGVDMLVVDLEHDRGRCVDEMTPNTSILRPVTPEMTFANSVIAYSGLMVGSRLPLINSEVECLGRLIQMGLAGFLLR
jgi:hypothetical protein